MMKKYISMAMVAIAAFTFSGCSNEDIQIDKSLTIKVSPSGVVAPFTYEVNKGELTAVPDQCTLRLRLLIYNETGKMVFSKTESLKSYTGNLEATPNLPNGKYTLLCISDIVGTNNYEYWTLSNGIIGDDFSQLRLSSVREENGTLRQGFTKNILGYECRQVVINESTQTLDLSMKPAGAVICVNFTGVKKFSSIDRLQLRTNQETDYVTFNAQGQLVFTSKRSQGTGLNGINTIIDPRVLTTKGNYVAYLFMPPTDITAAFIYRFDGESQAHYVGGSDRMTATLNSGDEYEALLDLNATNDISVDPVYSLTKRN